jgi:hypothetical protein
MAWFTELLLKTKLLEYQMSFLQSEIVYKSQDFYKKEISVRAKLPAGTCLKATSAINCF